MTRVLNDPLALGTGLFARSFGGGFDQVRNGGWLRDGDRMAARHLDDGGAGALGHETLGGWWNHFVVGYDQIPTRLVSPCGLTDGAAEGFDAPGDLRVGHERSFFRV